MKWKDDMECRGGGMMKYKLSQVNDPPLFYIGPLTLYSMMLAQSMKQNLNKDNFVQNDSIEILHKQL